MTTSITFVTELYYPEETSTGYYLTKIAESVAKDYPTQVICAQPTYSKRGIRAPRNEIHNGVQIYRCNSTTLDKNILFYKIINLFTFSFSIFIIGIRYFKSDNFVFVVTNPPTLPVIVAIACFLRKSKYILIIHDEYPEVLSVSGIIKNRSIIYKFIYWMNCQVYRHAARVITLGRDMQKNALKKVKSSDRVKIIPNWGDIDEVIPQDRGSNPLLKSLRLSDKFVLQFMGNIGRTHNIEMLLEAARLIEAHKNIHFLFIGWGAKRNLVELYIEKNLPENVTLLPIQDRANLSIALNACDVAVLPYINGMNGISVPSRMYNIMAAGKPILAIADFQSELGLVIQEESIGWIVPPDNIEKFINTILRIENEREIIQEMGNRARKAVVQKYNIENSARAYLQTILECVNLGQ